MSIFDSQISALFSIDLFRQLLNGNLSFCKLSILTSLLMQYGIPYNVDYDPGNRKDAAAIQLSIFINPTTTMVFTISTEGQNVFTINQ